MSARHPVLGAAAFAACLVVAVPVAAQTSRDADQQARVHFEVGRLHYDQGRFVQAAEEFARAYELSQNAMLLYNVFLANRDAGRLEEAVEALSGYLERVPDASNRAALEARLEAMLAQLRERNRSGADADPPSTDEPPQDDPNAPPQPTAERAAPVGAITTMSAGGGLLIASLVTGILAKRAESDLDAACPGRVACDPALESTLDRMQRLGLTTDILWTTGAAAAVSGLVWLIVRRSRREAPPEPVVQLGCGPGGCELSYRGAF